MRGPPGPGEGVGRSRAVAVNAAGRVFRVAARAVPLPLRQWRRRLLTRLAIREIIRRQVGQAPLWTRPVQPRFGALTGIVYAVGLPGTTLVFKAALQGLGSIATEAWAYERVRERGVPAPRVFAVDTGGTLFPTPYMIMEMVSGTPLRERSVGGARRPELLRHVGELLRLIHGIGLEGYGPLDEALYVRTGRVRGLHDTWRPAALRRLHWGLPYLEQHGLVDRSEALAIQRCLDHHQDILDAAWAHCLLHGDFQTKHLLADSRALRITGIIDFGDLGAGDAAWDLARFSLRDGDDLHDLLQGYEPDPGGREALQIRIPFYRFIHRFMIARWFHERGQVERARESLRLIQVFVTSHQRHTVGARRGSI